MGKKKFKGKGRSGAWWGNDRDRIIFEGAARHQFPDMKIGYAANGDRRYALDLAVPYYGVARHVEISFKAWGGKTPIVRVDGPTSKHRYGTDVLCMWYPDDSAKQRWVFGDGLLALIAQAQAHLFREEWFREFGWWPGDEAGHGEPKEDREEKPER